MKKDVPRRIHYVLSSHWDREWYQTFQDYRRRLVALLDRVLRELETGELRGPFTLDGQAIPIEDYLEIRPENRERIEAAIRSGRLKIGPWYVLPDEWLVSGEALVRNLELGRRIAREWGGEPSQAGFVCDLFGHVGQLPQILRGFGIEGGLVWRGLEPRAHAHIVWEGADGTELPCYRFGRAGYCDYTWDVRRSTEPGRGFSAGEALSDLRRFLAKEAGRTVLPPLLLFDGGDHLEPDADHYRLLFGQASGPDFPYKVVHSTLDAYLEEMLRHRKAIRGRVRGELREPAAFPARDDLQWLIPGILSSRVWIKQANAECQALLCHGAEPLACLAEALAGAEYPRGYLEAAWRSLLQNHPHDSIGGCSIDEVHEDMRHRFAQCRRIADAQASESLLRIAAAVRGEIGEKELRVVVANPLARDVDEPVELTLQIPAEWGCYNEFFGFEAKPGFRLFTPGGAEVPYQLLAQEMGRTRCRVRPLKYPEPYKTNDARVCLRLAIPALGYATLLVREGAWSPRDGAVGEQMLPTRHPQRPSLAASDHAMENEFLAVSIEANGTLTVVDKRTGETYRRLLLLEDGADIGDGWYHGQAVGDQGFVSHGARADIALVHDGAALCRFRVRVAMPVPAAYDFGARRRSGDLVPLVVDSEVTLRAGCDRIEVRTAVDNAARDHRLRVLFPSGVGAGTYFADSAFDVVERPVGLPRDNHLRRELAVETTPMQTWTAVAKGRRGLAVVAAGLLESAVRDLPERPIALTLFRATRRTVFTDGQPQGQLPGRLEFAFWIVPLARGVERRRLFDHGIRLAAGFRDVQLRAADVALHRGKARVPAAASLLAVKGEAVVTSVRRVKGRMQVRLFNPSDSRQAVSLRLAKARGAVPVDLEDRPVGKPMRGNPLSLAVGPKKIVTLRLLGV